MAMGSTHLACEENREKDKRQRKRREPMKDKITELRRKHREKERAVKEKKKRG